MNANDLLRPRGGISAIYVREIALPCSLDARALKEGFERR